MFDEFGEGQINPPIGNSSKTDQIKVNSRRLQRGLSQTYNDIKIDQRHILFEDSMLGFVQRIRAILPKFCELQSTCYSSIYQDDTDKNHN